MHSSRKTIYSFLFITLNVDIMLVQDWTSISLKNFRYLALALYSSWILYTYLANWCTDDLSHKQYVQSRCVHHDCTTQWPHHYISMSWQYKLIQIKLCPHNDENLRTRQLKWKMLISKDCLLNYHMFPYSISITFNSKL